MINAKQLAITIKDLKTITTNKRMFVVLLIVPLVLVIVMPSIFIMGAYFAPESMDDFRQLLAATPYDLETADMQMLIIELMINGIMPVFFIIIPIMAASVMAASSFVGEKEKHTLETLLYSPLSLQQIFQSKILASFAMSMMVSFGSFLAMVLVVEIELLLTIGQMVVPGVVWLVTMLLLSPAISLIAIILIVRGSAKAQSMEESQQRAVFLVLPVIFLVVGQFTGIITVGTWLLLALGVVVAVLAFVLMRTSMRKYSYELLLK